MSFIKKINLFKYPILSGIITFLILLVLTQWLSLQRYQLIKNSSQKELNLKANETKARLQEMFSNHQSSTQLLAFIIQNYGIPKDFDHVARNILKGNKYIDVLEIVEGGVITHVYPLVGNESILGYNILNDSSRNSGAFAAIENKQFFVAGPLYLKQGGTGIISRTPIFKNDAFWGFAAIVTRIPTVLHACGLDTNSSKIFNYQLVKVEPLTNAEEKFLPENNISNSATTVAIEIPNGEWKFYISSRSPGINTNLIVFIVLGVVLSLLVGFFTWYIFVQPSRLDKLIKEKTRLLQESETSNKTTLENISMGFFQVDNNHRIVYINKRIGQVVADDYSKYIGQYIFEAFPNAKNSKFYTSYQNAIQENKTLKIEEFYPLLNRWFEIYIHPSEEGVSVFLRDITDSRKAEVEKLKAQSKYLQLFNSNLAGVFQAKMDGQLINCNKAYSDLLGLESHEEISKLNINLLALDNSYHSNRVRLLQSTQSLRNFEVTMKSAENQQIHLLENSVLSFSPEYPEGLIEGIAIDITEKRKAEEQKRIATEQLRKLSEHIQTISETERTNIAREIHDVLGQYMTAIKFDISWLKKKWRDEKQMIEVEKRIASINEIVDETITSIRKISSDLRPRILDDLGLNAALEWKIEKFKVNTGIVTFFNSELEGTTFSKSISIGIYRIIQEALTNIARHTKADAIHITGNVEQNICIISIFDNGQGITEEALNNKVSFGILGMKERAKMMGGNLEITGTKGSGTKLVLKIPLS